MTTALLQRLIRDAAGHPEDAELLDRFVASRDAPAFEVLLRRHGPRVLSVCRRVLPADEAEDAFQATFLYLVQQAPKIRARESLRGWLLTVAHRVAMNARYRADRRQRREMVRAEVDAESPPADPSWKEACGILHAEVDRLPERFRLPVVLCYFEGLSRDEAARQLGWSEGVVKGRLERGRRLLKDRLTRRGIALSAGFLALHAGTAEARVRPELIRIMLEQAAGGRVSPALAAILPVATLSRRVAGLALGLVLTMALGLTALPFLRPANAMPGDPPPVGGAPAEVQTETLTIKGHVVGPDGKPFAGAALSLDGEKSLGVSGNDGDFALSVPAASLRGKSPELIATAPRHGAGWVAVPAAAADLTLRLVKDDFPIRGRIVDTEGKPLAGVKVHLFTITVPTSGDLTPLVRRLLKDAPRNVTDEQMASSMLGQPAASRLASATTDADGRFKLDGIGRGRLAMLNLTGLTIQQSILSVATLESLPAPGTGRPGLSVYAASFTHVAAPGRTLSGTVRERGSGKPLAGVQMVCSTSGARVYTDAQGHYEMQGFPKRPKVAVYANPNAETHFGTRIDVADQPGLAPIQTDFEVLRGIPFHGRILDRATGKPVMANVRYQAIVPNPNVRSAPGGELFDGVENFGATTKKDGSFTVPILPGPGAIFVEAKGGGYQGAFVDPEKFFGMDVKPGDTAYGDTERLYIQLGGDGQGLYTQDRFQAIELLNPAKDSGAIERDITLAPAASVRVQMLDPEGRSLAGVRVRGLTNGRPLGEVQPAAEFTVADWNPARPRVLEFRHDGRKLVGYVELRDGIKTPLQVTLQPWAEVSGRLLDAEGKPVAGVALRSGGKATPRGRLYGGVALGPITTDTDGRFKIEGLSPGVEYRFGYRSLGPPSRSGTLPDPVTLKPGETKDLGDVRVVPRMPNG